MIVGATAAAATVSVRVAVPVPLAFVAPRLIGKTPVWVGVPEMTPVFVSTTKPVGRGEAAKLVGLFDAVIVYE